MRASPALPHPRLPHALRIALFTALVIDTPCGYAQQAPAPQGIQAIEKVQVHAKRHDPRRNDTASRIVIEREALTAQGDTTLADAIKRLPGVTVEAGAPGSGGSIALRGLGAGYTQILINGQAAPAGLDIGLLAPEQVQRVEILRTASADMRNEGIAGTLNIVLADSTRTDSDHLKLGLLDNNGRQTPNMTWSHSRRREFSDYSVTASATRRAFRVEEHGAEQAVDAAATPELLRTTTVDAEGVRSSLSLSPSLNLTLDSGDRLGWKTFLDASDTERQADIAWITLLGENLPHARYLQNTHATVQQLRSELEWSHDFDNAGTLKQTLSVGGNRERSRFRERGYDPAGNPSLSDLTRGRIDTRTASSRGKYSLPPHAGHALEAGWELGVEQRDESRRQRRTDSASESPVADDLSFDARVVRTALFLQDEWSLAPLWSLYLGMRWERIDLHSDGNHFAQVRQRANLLTPVLQVLWKLPDAKDQLRLGLSRSYRAPEIRQLIPRPYTSTNNHALNPDEQGNPALRPELATGLDLAYEAWFDDDGMLSIGAYARRIENVIRSETRLSSGRWTSTPFNGGNARTWGLELEAKHAFPWSGHAPIETRFNLTRNWSTLDDLPGPDDRLARQPELSGSVSVDHRLGAHWTLGGSYTYRSGGTTRIGLQQYGSTSTRHQLDLYARLTLPNKARLRLSIADLLQQDIDSGDRRTDATGSQWLVRSRHSPPSLRADLEMDL